MDENARLKKSIIWNTLGNFIYFFLQWITMYLVTKLLDFDNAGIFSLCVSISTVVCNFAAFGMRNFQVSDINDKYADNTYVNSRVITCVVSIIATVLWMFASGYHIYQAFCITLYIIFRMSESFVDVFHGIMQKHMRMDIIGRSLIIRGLTTTVFFVITILITRNLLIGIIIMILAAFIPVYLYDRVKVKSFIVTKQNITMKDVLYLLFMCSPFAVYLLLTCLIPAIPRIFIGRLLGNYLLGVYSSIAIPAVIVQVCANYIFTPFVGIFSKQFYNNQFDAFVKLFVKIMVAIFLLSFVAIGGAYVLGDFALVLLYKKEILKYTYLFIPILVGTSLLSISAFLAVILTVFRNYIGLITGSLTGTICCHVGSAYFINKYGVNGANIILIVSLLIQIMIFMGFIIYELKKFKNNSKAFIMEEV